MSCSNQCTCTCTTTNCPEVCTAIAVSNSWNIPACGANAVLSVTGLTSVLIGTFLYNPSYGYYEITGFDSVNGQITVVNNCYEENAAVGSIVPSGTKFILSATSAPVRIDSGWFNTLAAGEVFSYASTTSVNVPSDATLTYQIGDKLKFTQSGVAKYFYIVGIPNSTTLILFGGSDYAVANAVITSPVISREDRPFDFPDVFNYLPTVTGFSVVPANAVYRVSIKGRLCTVFVRQEDTPGVSNDVSLTISAPVVARDVVYGYWGALFWAGVDNGVALTTPGKAIIGATLSIITVYKTIANGAWTNANNKFVNFSLTYEI